MVTDYVGMVEYIGGVPRPADDALVPCEAISKPCGLDPAFYNMLALYKRKQRYGTKTVDESVGKLLALCKMATHAKGIVPTANAFTHHAQRLPAKASDDVPEKVKYPKPASTLIEDLSPVTHALKEQLLAVFKKLSCMGRNGKAKNVITADMFIRIEAEGNMHGATTHGFYHMSDAQDRDPSGITVALQHFRVYDLSEGNGGIGSVIQVLREEYVSPIKASASSPFVDYKVGPVLTNNSIGVAEALCLQWHGHPIRVSRLRVRLLQELCRFDTYEISEVLETHVVDPYASGAAIPVAPSVATPSGSGGSLDLLGLLMASSTPAVESVGGSRGGNNNAEEKDELVRMLEEILEEHGDDCTEYVDELAGDLVADAQQPDDALDPAVSAEAVSDNVDNNHFGQPGNAPLEFNEFLKSLGVEDRHTTSDKLMIARRGESAALGSIDYMGRKGDVAKRSDDNLLARCKVKGHSKCQCWLKPKIYIGGDLVCRDLITWIEAGDRSTPAEHARASRVLRKKYGHKVEIDQS